MKTITLQGTEERFRALKYKGFVKEVETRVYVVDTHKVFNKSHSELTDDEFMTLAEVDGNVLTLPTFQKHFNIGEFDEPHYVIRFINVPKFD